MNDTGFSAVRTRYPLLAVVLSLLCIGLGQIYSGRLVRGLVLAFVGAAGIPVAAAMLANEMPVAGWALVSVYAGMAVIGIAAAADSYLLARRTRHDYVLKEYNRVSVYILLYLICKAAALGGLLYTRDSLIEAFVVPSACMEPAIASGDRILGNKRAYVSDLPARGDIVIFRDPERWRTNCVKRIVAVAGDRVEVIDREVIVNGRPIGNQGPGPEPHDSPPPTATCPAAAEYVIPAMHCFVLGDNADKSRDSRDFGVIPLTSIIARADYNYWPADTWARFGSLRRYP